MKFFRLSSVVVDERLETKIARGRVTVTASSVELDDPMVVADFAGGGRFFCVTVVQWASVVRRDGDGPGLVGGRCTLETCA